jgi:hypothetical protein
MQLPIFHTEDKDLSMMQTKWASVINPLLSTEIVNGNLLENISLKVGTNVINHLLGRKLIGWMIVGINGIANIYDAQANNQTPQNTLILISDAAVTVKVWCF